MALLRAGSVEGNVVMRGHVGTIAKVAVTGLELFTVKQLWQHGHKRTALVTAIAVTGAYGFIGARNLRVGQ